VVEKQAHHTHTTLHSAFTGSVACPQCGLDPANIVDGEAIGLSGEPPSVPTTAPPSAPRKPSRAELEARVCELEAEVVRLRSH
jgi:hypothetical protein